MRGFDDLKGQEVVIQIAEAENTLNKIAKSYLKTAYWAAFIHKAEDSPDKKYADLLRAKNFIYIFILDIGVSPFVKSYDGRLLI